ncbi:hypothetical protein [Allobranchiibius sp. GilTou38]|uniref:hypothetical protein n=1 Tax=Allobranchiibius sp. GilTou38 TaxID=2815210 RepID=UPI001AA0D5F7|nr:hypothetical protein [Allobranchiibius sp. GilTou38]MBO1767309.1 hypothetical protein [Allobranchiibius sp. GilTou38]
MCHLRDVCAAYTIRLHRARTEDEPVLEPMLEPMLNDLRARRFRCNDLDAVIAELQATATGFREEVARTGPSTGIGASRGCPVRAAPLRGWSARPHTRGSTISRTSVRSWLT